MNLENNAEGECKICDQNIATCSGGSSLIPKPGHWKYNLTSDLVLECPTGLACDLLITDGRLLDDGEAEDGLYYGPVVGANGE